jgi:putative aldouronate transport system substrate-binding protein
MFSKRLVFALFSMMVVIALLAACAPKPTEAPPAEPTEAPPAEATEAPPAEPTEEPAEIVGVTYTYPGDVPRDLQEVQDAINEILEAEINTRLILEPIDWGSFEDKVTLRFAAGEECDIVFTAPWINSYVQNVANGNLYPLDDLLPEYAPGLWASMPESTWEAARVQGHIYAVINQQIFPKPWGIEARADLAEKYGLDLDSIHRWEDVEPWLEAVKEGEGITPWYWRDDTAGLFMHQYYGFDPVDDAIGTGTIGLLGIRYDDPDATVLLMAEQPEFVEAMELARKWYLAGYLPEEVSPPEEMVAAYQAGRFAIGIQIEKPGNEAELKAAFGWDFVIKNLTDPLILDTAGAAATLNGVCASSPHPENAMMVLEMLNTNVDVYTLLCRGIEGKHWVWVDKEQNLGGYPEGVDGSTSGYNPNTDWMFGNQFNVFYRDPIQVGAWPATREMNDSAIPSPALGFAFDRTPVETEIAQVNAAAVELAMPLYHGWVDPEEAIPELIAALKEAGIEVIMEEMQRQLDEWKASK